MKVEVEKEYNNTYLKRYLKKIFEDIEVYGEDLFEKILINNEKTKKDYKVKSGDLLEINIKNIKLK